MSTTPLRVLHVAEILQGGCGAYMDDVISSQVELLGIDNIRVVVPDSQAKYLPSVPPSVIHTYPRTGRNFKSLKALAGATLSVQRNFRPTVAHVHSTFAGFISRPTLAFAPRKPKIVYCAHGWSFLMEVPGWQQKVYTLIERGLSLCSNAIIDISKYEYDEATRLGMSTKNRVVVRNTVRIGPMPEAESSPFDPEKINLLFVGVFRRQKGLDLLLKAMPAVADLPIMLHVIGATVGEGEDPSAKPQSNVKFYGWMDRRDLDRYYGWADALIVPSRWEGFGLVALEAMRQGTAVLASSRGALPEVVVGGETGEIFDLEEGEPRSLIKTLRGLDKARLTEQGKAARYHAETNFSPEQMNRRLREIYHSVVEGRFDKVKSDPLFTLAGGDRRKSGQAG